MVKPKPVPQIAASWTRSAWLKESKIKFEFLRAMPTPESETIKVQDRGRLFDCVSHYLYAHFPFFRELEAFPTRLRRT